MKRKRRIGIVRLFSIGLLFVGAAGCSNNANSSKTTPQEMQTFRGDPSKMPANMQQQIDKQRSDAMKKAAETQADILSKKGGQ